MIAICLLLTVVTFTSARDEPQHTAVEFGAAVALSILPCAALWWRRRWPVPVFVVAIAPSAFAPIVAGSALAPAVIALYSIAVYASSRAALWALGGASVGLALVAAGWTLAGVRVDGVGQAIGSILLLTIGALIGINVGGRKRYVEALIDRSRQLAIERDQQARLAAAAERTRIAREMHDIVSHSLTVVVALAEGAIATDDPERSRQASRAVAATAREALSEMRVMLGVLRTDADAPAGDAPLAPLLELSLSDIVAAARAAGFPVTLTVAGAPHGSAAQRLAVLRIVQEGLTNAMRYAHDPAGIRVLTEYTPDRIRVVIDNDGVRADDPSAGAGLGLQGLRERVATLGGSFTAGPSAPGSWRLEAEIPTEEKA